MEDIKPIIFKLDNESYGIDISLVNAIEPSLQTVKIPNAPSHIKGIINLRGDIIPVFSLRSKFNMKEQTENSAEQKIIVTNIKGMPIALEVDMVSEIQTIDKTNITDVPEIVKSYDTLYIKSIAKIDQNIVIILNTEKLMSDEEQENIAQFMINQ
ncbi:chemotaxis protein CheW [Candidatus Galacturonibacter soehngenii]|uniref:Purine-binding chemotaxis protein CheW n=1 Tax=Candidatus Galacturonatibacter soehngenii TaxID=2307010 RepID=A0A7V7QIC2_9FIRM|nr:chemotaxis protein CheW [Candidatus Galacturonibacter soehngenii]KAB1434539.1 purine-binding chemotaxis protein CheW [Candidatus Galacturonibacter soehngenii]MBA4688155.1 purine-binding chemotaxis protein CheW [Candidatus Galacturonibacter soehngenii]